MRVGKRAGARPGALVGGLFVSQRDQPIDAKRARAGMSQGGGDRRCGDPSRDDSARDPSQSSRSGSRAQKRLTEMTCFPM